MIILLWKVLSWSVTVIIYVVTGPLFGKPSDQGAMGKAAGWQIDRQQRLQKMATSRYGAVVGALRRSAQSLLSAITITLAALVILTLLYAVWQPFIWRRFVDESAPVVSLDAGSLAALSAIVVALLSLGVAAFGFLLYRVLERSIREVAVREGHLAPIRPCMRSGVCFSTVLTRSPKRLASASRASPLTARS